MIVFKVLFLFLTKSIAVSDLHLERKGFQFQVQLPAIFRGKVSAVIPRLMFKCLCIGWK